jgi:predicted Zn-dependent peptidase
MPKTMKENAVYYCSNKNYLKSDIDFYMPSVRFDHKKDGAACAMFNECMGGGMNSIFFQEIREFRSLGYSTGGRFSYDILNRRPAYFRGYVGTQCDKTNDAVSAMRELMVTFPERKEKYTFSRDFLVSERNSNYIGFRSIPSQVRYWREVEKVDHDPRAEVTEAIKKMSFDDLMDFHKKYVKGRPMVIMVSGNAKKFNLKDLGQYGKVKQVKYGDMIKFE